MPPEGKAPAAVWRLQLFIGWSQKFRSCVSTGNSISVKFFSCSFSWKNNEGFPHGQKLCAATGKSKCDVFLSKLSLILPSLVLELVPSIPHTVGSTLCWFISLVNPSPLT